MNKIMNNVAKVKERINELIYDESGMGTVEIILIIVVLIGLVIIFQDQLKGLVESIFETIKGNAGVVTGNAN